MLLYRLSGADKSVRGAAERLTKIMRKCPDRTAQRDALFGQNGKRAVSGRLMQRCAANGAVAAKRDGLFALRIRAEAAAESPPYGHDDGKGGSKIQNCPRIIQQKHMQKQQADDTKTTAYVGRTWARRPQRRNFCDIETSRKRRQRRTPQKTRPAGR